MAKIDEWPALLIDRVEEKVAEQLDHVAITSLRPAGVVIESKSTPLVSRCLNLSRCGNTHSGRSLMKPNLHKRRTSLAFSSSRIKDDSRLSL